MIPSDRLAFRLSARQRRAHLVLSAVFASAAPVVACAGDAIFARGFPIGSGWGAGLAAVWTLAGLIILAFALLILIQAGAVTECTPAGLRARTTRGRVREWPWPQVAAITVDVRRNGRHVIKLVMVTTTGGSRVRLVTPVTSGELDETFTAEVRQIQDYWTAAVAAARTEGSP